RGQGLALTTLRCFTPVALRRQAHRTKTLRGEGRKDGFGQELKRVDTTKTTSDSANYSSLSAPNRWSTGFLLCKLQCLLPVSLTAAPHDGAAAPESTIDYCAAAAASSFTI